MAAAVCCSKPRAPRRAATPRTLRSRFATDRQINLSCGFDERGGGAGGSGAAGLVEEGGTATGGASSAVGSPAANASAARYLLGVLTRSNEADERYEIRRRLPRHAAQVQSHGRGRVRACFVFDATPPHGGRRKPGALFNTRAWLLYEAGRRADIDLTALSAQGNFRPTAPNAKAHWWRRAAAHAEGPHAYAYYALSSTPSLLGGTGGGVAPPAWVPRADVAKKARELGRR